MAEIKDDGGAAFPMAEPPESMDENECGPVHLGMSLRDYFAGQALGLAAAADYQQRIKEIQAGVFRHSTREDVAATAYKLADAMIAERKK